MGFHSVAGDITSRAAFTASAIGPEAVKGRVLDLYERFNPKMSVTRSLDPSSTPEFHA